MNDTVAIKTLEEGGETHKQAQQPQATSGRNIKSIIPKFLLAESIVAGPTYNRWLFPPAALLVHFSIGQCYAYSVFNKPLIHLCGRELQGCENWGMVQVGWIFQLFFVFLGSSAAIFGRSLESLGPRFAGVMSACCWGLGYVLASVAVKIHSLPLLYIGSGVIGGIGLGLGYISPVSTLMKWFPDRRGMATGLAIGGFGGGAVIGAPLSVMLMLHYTVSTSFLILGGIYFVAILAGALAYRVPPHGWKPTGWDPATARGNLRRDEYVDANRAVLTPQFWLLWIILCMNVSCGIGVLSQASPIVQDMFHGRITALEAGGIVGLFSLFNIGGRLFWSSLSDKIGRWSVYSVFFLLGIALYATTPSMGHQSNFAGFFACVAVIVSMYGGGFAAIPAYIADIFGIKHSGAIHGRVLTAWSAAAVMGPYMLNSIRKRELSKGRPISLAYDKTLYILCGLLAIGLTANTLVPVVNRLFPIKRTVREDDGHGEMGHEAEEAKGSGGGEEGRAVEMVPVHGSKPSPSSPAAEGVGEAGGPLVLAGIVAFWCVPLTGFGWGLYKVMQTGIKAFH